MRITLHLLAKVLPRAAVGAAVGLVLGAWFVERPLPGAGADAAAAATLWLHLPAGLATVAGLAHLIEVWPTFARGRSGGAVLARSLSSRFAGTAAAALGAALALALVLATLGALFPTFLGLLGRTVPQAHEIASFRAVEHDAPFLGVGRPRLTFLVAEPRALLRLRLAPLGVLDRDSRVAASRVRVHARGPGGERELGVLEFAGSHDAKEVDAGAFRVHEVVLERLDGPGIALAFPPESVVGIAAEAWSPRVAFGIAALGYLWPAGLFLVLALLLRGLLAMPVLLALLVATPVLTVAFDLVPTAAAITELARGRAPLAGSGHGILQNGATAASFSVALLAMILAMVRRSQPLA